MLDLPIAACALCVAMFHIQGLRFRPAVLAAAATLGFYAVAIAYVLSIGRHLTAATDATAWALLDVVLSVGVFRGRRRLQSLRLHPRSWDWVASCAWALTATLAALAGLAGFTSMVVNIDSLGYHVPRIAHWAQLHGVVFYPTPNPIANFIQPGAEIVQLHTYVLTGGDQDLALVQSVSLVLCAFAASLLAEHLGMSRRVQALTALLFASTPAAVLEASSTRNDLIATAWFAIILVGLTGKLSTGGRYGRLIGAACTSAALALTADTKLPELIFAAPFIAAWLFRPVLRRPRRPRLLPGRLAGLVAACALASSLSLPLVIDNYNTYGRALGPIPDQLLLENRPVGLRAGVAVSLRYTFSQAASPDAALNRRLNGTENSIEGGLGLRGTRPDTDYLSLPYAVSWTDDEDLVGGPVQTVLILVSSLLIIAFVRRRARLCLMTCAVLAGAFLVCVELRWQPYGQRFFLPTFLVGSATSLTAMGLLPKALRRVLGTGVVSLAVLLAFSVEFHNDNRPLIGPRSVLTTPLADQIVGGQGGQMGNIYQSAVDAAILDGPPASVGFRFTSNDLEYVWWQTFGLLGLRPIFTDVGPDAVDDSVGPASPPDVVICSTCQAVGGTPAWLATASWTRTDIDGKIAVFRHQKTP